MENEITTGEQLAEAVLDVAKNYKTLYVMGCFGAPLNAANKKRYTRNHSYNRRASRTKLINAASEDTFGFDCVCLIKGLLWGWSGDVSKNYGGAVYASNGVPDIGADAVITKCSGVSSNFSRVEVGELVWMKGHVGVYVGDGLAVECSPAWQNKVQVTACNCTKPGYKRRNWTKHGKLPYISYTSQSGTVNPATPEAAVTEKKATEAAKSLNKALAGTYEVTAAVGLHIRDGAGTTKKSLTVLPNGTKVRNYGYYTSVGNAKWLYIQVTYKNVKYTGFSSSKYLEKV